MAGENPFTAEKDIFDNQVVMLEFENEVRATLHMSAGIEEGLRAATTCFAIDQAADEGQVVDLADYWQTVA
jgi:hypothetical protein